MRRILLLIPLLASVLLMGCKEEVIEPMVGNIEGVLLNGSKLVEEADIVVYHNGVKYAQGVTNDKGEFIMKNLPVGDYILKGLLNDVYSKPTEVTLTKGDTLEVQVNFKLKLAMKALIYKGFGPHPMQRVTVHAFDRIDLTNWDRWDPYATFDPQNPDNSLIDQDFTDELGYVEIWDLAVAKYVFIAWDETDPANPVADFIVQYYNGVDVLDLNNTF